MCVLQELIAISQQKAEHLQDLDAQIQQKQVFLSYTHTHILTHVISETFHQRVSKSNEVLIGGL